MLTQDYKQGLHEIWQQPVAQLENTTLISPQPVGQLQNLIYPQAGDELHITLM